MDFNWILLWISGVSTAVNLAVALRGRHAPVWGWRAILTSILLSLVVLWQTVPDLAGYIVGPLWLALVLAPGLLMKQVNRLISQRKHRRAFWAAQLASWLHPFDGWPQQASLVQSLMMFEQGRTDAAAALIDRLGNIDTSLGRTARLIQAQQTGDWPGLLRWIDTHYPLMATFQDEALLTARTQALGELGQTREMLAIAAELVAGHLRPPPLIRGILQMRIAALSGLVPATERALATLSQTYPDDVRQFWLLTARQVAGDESAAEGFRQLQQTAGPYLKPMIARRLAEPLAPFDGLQDPHAASVLDALARRIAADAESPEWETASSIRPWATWAIAAVLVVTFASQVPEGGWNPDTPRYVNNLIDMGALIIPQAFTPGEWWRVVTAGFLHFGTLHLGLNLLGLLAFAPRLERAWGRLPMLTCYLTATITSMAVAPHVMNVPQQEFRVLVGASGGIMGLVGGLAGYMLISWLRHRSDDTRRPLVFLLLIIALQTTFDLSTPNVSFACHSLGLATGAMFGIVWTWLTNRRTER